MDDDDVSPGVSGRPSVLNACELVTLVSTEAPDGTPMRGRFKTTDVYNVVFAVDTPDVDSSWLYYNFTRHRYTLL